MSLLDTIGPFGEVRAASGQTGASLSAAVTSASAFVAFPPGSEYAYLEARGLASAAVVQVLWNPYLTILKTTDALAGGATATTEYSAVAQNNLAQTGGVVLSSFATSHHLWVGAEIPFGGLFCDVSAANGNAATVAATYWSGSTMAALSVTDGTASGGATLAQDGSITWTLPTDWAKGTLRAIASAAASVPQSGRELYWARLTVSAALDASVTLDQVLARNRSASYALMTAGNPGRWYRLHTGTYRHGCIEAKTDAGTGFLIVNVATRGMFP